jgi:hypothetical protein
MDSIESEIGTLLENSESRKGRRGRRQADRTEDKKTEDKLYISTSMMSNAHALHYFVCLTFPRLLVIASIICGSKSMLKYYCFLHDLFIFNKITCWYFQFSPFVL